MVNGTGMTGSSHMEPLSTREWQVVETILRNVTTRDELARQLVIGRGTVNTHVWRIFQKTGARCMPELILMATGLVDCPIPLPSGRMEE